MIVTLPMQFSNFNYLPSNRLQNTGWQSFRHRRPHCAGVFDEGRKTMNKSNAPVPLKMVLVFDAFTCAAMGVLLAGASGWAAELTALPASLLFWAGLVLFPVAIFMAAFAYADQVPGWASGLIVTGNILWAIASLLLPVTGLVSPNSLGWAFLLVQAVAVLCFTWLEWKAARLPLTVARPL
jgi:hypothetical protein